MAKLIYRIVSACGALGYGFPKESLQTAMTGRVDAVISDAGSMDAGPYYLGAGTQYFEREAVKNDFRQMVEAGKRIDGPVILGSCGMAGGDRNLEWMLDVAREVFEELDVRDAKVAVIHSELDPAVVIDELRAGRLRPVGAGPELSEASLRDSTIVGQMGIHPILAALESGAKYIFAGRSCDVALFAADMIRRGIAPGLAYHVGHVLECGALACDPGSPSDCLVAEIYDDGSAVFTAPNDSRRCTPYSIAAHSLYEESHPQLQFYPEGVLAMASTAFFAVDARSAGIRDSRFYRTGKPWPLSIKLEGSRRVGMRKVSLIHLRPGDMHHIPADVLVYGRNGVEKRPAGSNERELGIIVQTRARTPEAATMLASLLTHYLIHYGYAGRESTAGNIAYPLSPNLVNFRYENGTYGAIVPSGTRDPIFIAKYATIRQQVVELVRREFPEALADAQYEFVEADAERPVALLRTIHDDAAVLDTLHRAEIERIASVTPMGAGSLLALDAADAYEWTLFHLLQNEEVIREQMFPIRHYLANGSAWTEAGETRARYFDIGEPAGTVNLDDRSLSSIEDVPPQREAVGKRRLLDMARVIRSKNAGVNRITFDVLFVSKEMYETALYSNMFCARNLAEELAYDVTSIVGAYFVDNCNGIKVTIERPIISASRNERDVFGAQQQSLLERMVIPTYAGAL
ncbi:DUF4387 family protein [Caballeronia cordobensis]|uniref:DUF4387 family protein n=1 Tax=Caballeronia cordobensis TaxID=1353886 RepID=UPI00045EF739|nr:uncharacterized protein BRPE67_DCDS02640 [Burkholderia sp. RPE67]